MGNIQNPADMRVIRKRVELLNGQSQAQWGKMDVNQMVVHLTDQLRCAKGDLKTEKRGNILHRTLARWLVMAGMKAPKGKVMTVPEFDQEKDGTAVTGFDNDRKTLLEILDWYAAAPIGHAWQNHPVFGPMGKQEWGRLAYTHLDHHLRQFGV